MATTAKITKIEVMANKATKNPILYCHKLDRNHNSEANICIDDNEIRIDFKTNFKIKDNPQDLNRIDIYMSMNEARIFADALSLEAGQVSCRSPIRSKANPHAARKGQMELPDIISSWYVRPARAEVASLCELRMRAEDAYLNIDYESPHESHTKMKTREIHLGLTLMTPSANHNPDLAKPENVPEHELQNPIGRPPEINPVPKVRGRVSIWISRENAKGISEILKSL